MKTMNKLIIATFLIGMLLCPRETRTLDNWVQPTLITAAVVAVGAIVYMNTDSNATLLDKADRYMYNLDTCQDLLPPAMWYGTPESYFEQYMQHKFGVSAIDMHKASDCNYHMVRNYVNKMQNSLSAARHCVEFRSTFFDAMHEKLLEIKALERLLAKASDDVHHYDNFLLGHQIVNFHASLPTLNPLFTVHSSPLEQQSAVVKWARRGFFSNGAYPLMSYLEQVSSDLKFIRQHLSNHGYYTSWYPKLSERLRPYQQALEDAMDLLLDSPAYQAEKDAKHKEEILLAEQAKARAQEQAARAQQAQARAQQDQAWAQHRQAWAKEEANRIEREKKK